jgi:hypothetical protein
MWQVYLVDLSIGERQRVADVVRVEAQGTAFYVCQELEPHLQEGIAARCEQTGPDPATGAPEPPPGWHITTCGWCGGEATHEDNCKNDS